MHLLVIIEDNKRYTIHVLKCSACILCLVILSAPSCSEIISINTLKISTTGYVVVAVVVVLGSYLL